MIVSQEKITNERFDGYEENNAEILQTQHDPGREPEGGISDNGLYHFIDPLFILNILIDTWHLFTL